MQPTLEALHDILSLNTDLFLNCLDGVSEGDASKRPLEDANSMAFLAVHAIDARHTIARLMGNELKSPLQEQFANIRSVEEVDVFPPLTAMRQMWLTISEHLEQCCEGVTADELAVKVEPGFPTSNQSTLGALIFLVQHESYHIGQMSLLRKGLGYEAMSYKRTSLG